MSENGSGGDTLLIAPGDIGPLLVDRLGAVPGPASPLKGLLASYRPGSGALSDAGAALAGQPELAPMVRVLTDPSLVVVIQEGGGPRPVVRRVTCHAPGHGGGIFVTVSEGMDGALVLERDGSPWLFLARWLRRIGGHPESGVPNPIPPPTTPTELALLLHAVDLYRRVQLENLLDPEGHPETDGIGSERLVPTLVEAFERRDPRWLLGAWLAMAPDTGLEDAAFDDPALLDVLVERRFLLPAEPGRPDSRLLFGPSAVETGIEFMLAWSGCCGFRYSTVRDGRLEPLAGAFLATTGLTHHLFFRRDGDGGEALAVHQTFDRKELETFMARIMARALEAVGVSPDAAPAPGPPRCPSCGAEAVPGARFCGHCGHPLG